MSRHVEGLFELGVPGPMRDRLVAAVLSGVKVATSSLLVQYVVEGEPLPRVGERRVVVGSAGDYVAVVEVLEVSVIRFGDADEALARDEGEGFRSVGEWREAHEAFWRKEVLPDLPRPVALDDETKVVVERFRVVSGSRLPDRTEGYGLLLRRWLPGDAEELHRVVTQSAEHLGPWMDWVADRPQSLQHERRLLERWDREWAAGGDATFAIVRDGQIAGASGLHRRRGPSALEIGYWTHPAFLRQGIATAAARLLTALAFTVPGIERVEIHHDKANRASGGVPRSLGYRFIGEQPDAPTAPAEQGIDCTWLITRREWLGD